MKEEVEVSQIHHSRIIPVSVVIPEPREFVRGGIAALANIICTFPIYKLMFRQQLSGNGVATVTQDLYREGIRTLYRGVGPPIVQKTISTSVMFGTFDFYRRFIVYYKRKFINSQSEETVLIRLTASTLSGLTEALLTPFERIQTLLSIPTYNTQFKNFLHAFSQLSFRELYTGMSAIACRNCLGSGLFLFFREPFQNLLPHSENTTVNFFMSGAVLGACISTLSFPFNVAKVQMQKYSTRQPNITVFGTINNVIKERGLTGLYKGAQVNFGRALLSWGIVNAVYELLGNILPSYSVCF